MVESRRAVEHQVTLWFKKPPQFYLQITTQPYAIWRSNDEVAEAALTVSSRIAAHLTATPECMKMELHAQRRGGGRFPIGLYTRVKRDFPEAYLDVQRLSEESPWKQTSCHGKHRTSHKSCWRKRFGARYTVSGNAYWANPGNVPNVKHLWFSSSPTPSVRVRTQRGGRLSCADCSEERLILAVTASRAFWPIRQREDGWQFVAEPFCGSLKKITWLCAFCWFLLQKCVYQMKIQHSLSLGGTEFGHVWAVFLAQL